MCGVEEEHLHPLWVPTSFIATSDVSIRQMNQWCHFVLATEYMILEGAGQSPGQNQEEQM